MTIEYSDFQIIERRQSIDGALPLIKATVMVTIRARLGTAKVTMPRKLFSDNGGISWRWNDNGYEAEAVALIARIALFEDAWKQATVL